MSLGIIHIHTVWVDGRIIGEGGAGAVFLAKLVNPKSDAFILRDEFVCVKVPWLDGDCALEEVLEEASAHIQIQERLRRRDARSGCDHIVPFVGFCCELPTVALISKYLAGGDLMHKLRDLKKEAGLEDQTETERPSSTTPYPYVCIYRPISGRSILRALCCRRVSKIIDIIYFK